ncbi:MAG TPA: MarR family transcriptional regulator [Pseudoduganella sp.]|jgi:DNA-binding MarR family transcriptional regulator
MDLRQGSLEYLLSDINRLMRRKFAQRMEGNTLAQGKALIFVSNNEGIRQVDLAALLEVQPITLARLLDQLEANGLVERRADPTDRRAYRIYLTPVATPHLDKIDQLAAQVRAETLLGIDSERQVLLMEALHQMRANLITDSPETAGEHS